MKTEPVKDATLMTEPGDLQSAVLASVPCTCSPGYDVDPGSHLETCPYARVQAAFEDYDPASAPKTPEQTHEWQDQTRCMKCDIVYTRGTNADSCSGEDSGSRALTQLGGCLLAAEGNATGTNDAEKGDYGWSPAFQAVKELWDEGDRLRMSLEHCRQATLANFDADTLPASGEDGVELHAFTAIRELRHKYDAERAANADKVKTIYRQCRERRALCLAGARGDMAGLREILFPPESDEPESVEELMPAPCDPEKIKDKLVIRFDGPPGPVPGRFVETELNGKGVHAGEWVQDEEYWLLVIEPDAIPPQKLPGDLASRRGEHIRALMVERDRLKECYAKARVRELEAKCPDSVLGPPQVYRIAYRTVAGAKPTFIHVRAESPTRALMAFIDETSTLQVSSLKLDNEYDGPLLNEQGNFWPGSNEAKVMQEDIGDNDEDDTETYPVVREGT